MRILFVSSECAPFAKAGGLGDVVGALPKALASLGHDVRVLIPRYAWIERDTLTCLPDPLGVPLGQGQAWCAVCVSEIPGSEVPIYFLEHDALFGGTQVYDGCDDSLLGLAKFGLLCRGAFQLCRALDFVPDLVHVHDWPTGFIPIMLNTVESEHPFLRTASVMTIHNMAHQPRFPAEGVDILGVGREVLKPDGLEDYGKLNPFKGGLYHATMLTTVSPRYAQEIRTEPGGAGLHEAMRFRGADLVGVLNGIDVEAWDPRTDPALPMPYGPQDLQGKRACKLALQRELGLEERADVPLISNISRLNFQKGTDVMVKALERILEQDAQVVMLGTGDEALTNYLRHRSSWGGGHFRAWIGYNEDLAHRIEAASDLFLMPSRFEPCGLNQLYSQRYGTLPIVRATGGLDDTVEQCDPDRGTGTGFKFWDLTVDAVVDTVSWAVGIYRNNPALFRAMQVQAMKKDSSWGPSARRYEKVYDWALERKRPAQKT